jgi:hypothetical protein
MLQGARQASVPSTEGPRPNTANSATIPHSDQPPRDAAAPEGGRGGTGVEESLVRGSVVAPRVSCGICGGLLRDATAFTECLHACKLQMRLLSMWASWPPGMGMASLSPVCSLPIPIGFRSILILQSVLCSMVVLSAVKKEGKKLALLLSMRACFVA